MGPDYIPNWILKTMSDHLAGPVCSLINSSFREGFLPQLWKSADVSALPKTSPLQRLDKDLRPISLTPVLSKLTESHMRDWVMANIEDILDPLQFGSLTGRCTTHALIQLHHSWCTEVDRKDQAVRVLLIDFRKAFDLVDHQIILQKLANTGLPNFIIRWLTQFLCNRKQRVKINNECSPWRNVFGGVPQGTLLGPVCFILHINDLQTVCPSVKYVDDSTLWESCCYDGADSQLQTATDQVAVWTQKNHMALNVDKTKEMLVWPGRRECTIPHLTIDGAVIERVESTKLLGVIMSNDLRWERHVQHAIAKASKRIYFLRLLHRAGVHTDDILGVYTSIIRSVLEYAAELWHAGLTMTQCEALERVQKRVLRLVMPDASYIEALEQTGLQTLEARREVACRKLWEDMQRSTHPLHHLLPPRKKTRTLRSNRLFPLPVCKTNRLKNTFLNYSLFNYQ